MQEPTLPPEWKLVLNETEYFWEPSIGKFHNRTLGRGLPIERIINGFTPDSWVKFHKSSMEEYNKDPEKYMQWRSDLMAKRQGCCCIGVLGLILIFPIIIYRLFT